MALLFFLLLLALTWSLGALWLWPRARWAGEVPLWIGGTLAIGVAACVARGLYFEPVPQGGGKRLLARIHVADHKPQH